jgi:rhodanese-related sulfurtransferase
MLLLLVVNCKEASNAEVKLVTAEEMQELTEIEDVQLVDVRTPSEFEEGFIANAQNIDYNSPYFEKEIAKLDKSKPVLVYCEKGGRSAKCVDKMKDAGFVKIYDLQGGMAKWKFKGFEVKTLH